MRVLLAANASYAPPRGGATRSNLYWLERLARAGHEPVVVCSRLPGAPPPAPGAGPITIRAAASRREQLEEFRRQAEEWRPDWVLVSSEDVGHGLLHEAQRLRPGRVVYLAHTPQFFPFGPESWNPDAEATANVRRAAAVVAIGQHMAGYIERHAGCRATVIHPPIYGPGPWPTLGRWDFGLVTMINPCVLKGIDIFLELAARNPAMAFGAMPGWGTTRADRERLAAHRNIQIFPNFDDINDFFRLTRILLMPSLWYEGFGLITMEAMLRGVPVIASDSGGLAEAKSGTGYVLPNPGILRYEPEFDEHALPRAVTAEIPIEPWAAALANLLEDPAAYEREAQASRAAALRFVSALDPDAFVRFLEQLPPPAPRAVDQLTSAERALLLARLKARRGAV